MARIFSGSHDNLTVTARRQLQTPEAAAKFVTDLEAQIEKGKQAGNTVAFNDLDISQNPIPTEEFVNFFQTLQSSGVKVLRMRLFGCATFNDEVALSLAEWLGSLTADTILTELHLSDCAITGEGFGAIMSALEGNEAYPFNARGGKELLYMRLENNYILNDHIQEKMDSGSMVQFQKGERQAGGGADAKVKMLVQRPGNFQQKHGDPPSPEDAPPPKEVKAWQSDQQQNGKGNQKGSQGNWGNNAWSGGGNAWGGMQNMWPAMAQMQQAMGGAGANAWWAGNSRPAAGGPRPAVAGVPRPAATPASNAIRNMQQARPAGAGAARPGGAAAAWRPQGQVAGGMKGAAAAGMNKPAGKLGGPGAASQARPFTAFQGNAAGGGNAGARAVDRSRTPAGKGNNKAKGGAMPHGWEEHHSDEYGIPYFWHADSGEAVWERPTA